MIGILFLRPDREDAMSRLIDKAFKATYGDDYFGYTHVAVCINNLVGEVTTEGIFVHNMTHEDEKKAVMKRLGCFLEFVPENREVEVKAQMEVLKRLDKAFDDGEVLIEDELIDWFFDRSLRAYNCVTFVLEVLGLDQIENEKGTMTPQELLRHSIKFPECYEVCFEAANLQDAVVNGRNKGFSVHNRFPLQFEDRLDTVGLTWVQ